MTDGTGTLAPPLGTPAARVLLVGFVVVHLALALPTAAVAGAPATLTALLLSSVAATLLVLTRPGRLPAGRTAAVLLLVAAAANLVVPRLPAAGWPGYAAWPIGACTFIAIGLTLRGRIGAAWIAMGILAEAALLWALGGGATAGAAIGLVDRQAGTLLIGTLFAIALRRAARVVDELHAAQRRSTVARATREAEVDARRAGVASALAAAGPTLAAIAAGRGFDQDERDEVLALEGRLRDEISLGGFLTPRLELALTEARRRGVDVTMLADPRVRDAPVRLQRDAADWLTAALDAARGSRFVGRAVARKDGLRVSATDDESTTASRLPRTGE